MKEGNYKLIKKEALGRSESLWRMEFDAPGIDFLPGQFVNLAVEGRFLRRPFSVSDYKNGVLTLIVQIVGNGTKKLVELQPGTSVNMLAGLGNPFEIPALPSESQILLVGGGVGYAPLVGLMRKLREETSYQVYAVFGFSKEADVPSLHINELKEKFEIEVGTLDGDAEHRGNVIEVGHRFMKRNNLSPDYFYSCGPAPMLDAVMREYDIEGQVSLEARMGCGFGACMGCSIETKDGPRRICKEGPVFYKSNLVF